MSVPPSRIEESRREAGLSPPSPAGERWRHAARLIGCWWFSREWKFAWAALLLLFAISSSGIFISIWSNRWQQQFFDSIQYRRAGLFGALVVSFLLILASQVGMSLARTFVDQMIRLRWRTFLTARYLDRWFARDRYYEIERLRLIDNPDQRIADDINLLTAQVHGLTVGFITTMAGAISFSLILMETAQAIRFDLFGRAMAIPGDLVIYAWAYALFGSAMIVVIGRPFVRRTMRQQHYEADFRAGLIHVRRHAGQVSFAGAQPVERRSLGAMFANIQRNFFRLVLADMGIKLGSETYERVAGIIPLVVTVPRFFTGAISFGQVMGARDAFGQLVSQLSYFVQAYGEIGKQIANVNRLKALDDAIDDRRPRGIAFLPGDTGDGVALATRGLVLARPNGGELAEIGDWEVAEGTRWVIQGASGAGKSTLLRALAGLWPDGRGSVAMAGGRLTMLVPQRLYLPLGTLKDAVCFPDDAAAHDDAAIVDLLQSVGLAAHSEYIHEPRMWQDELSPGEQQRVALARILLQRPALLVLDEATSALDPAGAQVFYRTLLDRLPRVTLVSVVHDEGLVRFHTHRLDIADGKASTGAVA